MRSKAKRKCKKEEEEEANNSKIVSLENSRLENEWTKWKEKSRMTVLRLQSTVYNLQWHYVELKLKLRIESSRQKKTASIFVKKGKRNQELRIVYIAINKWKKAEKRCHEVHLTNQFPHLFYSRTVKQFVNKSFNLKEMNKSNQK